MDHIEVLKELFKFLKSPSGMSVALMIYALPMALVAYMFWSSTQQLVVAIHDIPDSVTNAVVTKLITLRYTNDKQD